MNIKIITSIYVLYFFLIFSAYESYGKALTNGPVARWQLEPRGTPTSIIMRAEAISETNVSYYFESLSAGGLSSGWQNSNTYVDSNLTAGVSYSYRFKIRYGTSGNETIWSTSVAASTISTTLLIAGGFDCNCNRYYNSDGNVFGIGPATNPMVNNSGIRAIYHAQVGVHPRIYFGPDERPDILARLKNTPSGRIVAKTIHAYTTLW